MLWCAGVDTGAYQAVNCRLRRPELFAGAIGLSGLYDMSRFMGSEADDLILRNSPLNALAETSIYNTAALPRLRKTACCSVPDRRLRRRCLRGHQSAAGRAGSCCPPLPCRAVGQ